MEKKHAVHVDTPPQSLISNGHVNVHVSSTGPSPSPSTSAAVFPRPPSTLSSWRPFGLVTTTAPEDTAAADAYYGIDESDAGPLLSPVRVAHGDPRCEAIQGAALAAAAAAAGSKRNSSIIKSPSLPTSTSSALDPTRDEPMANNQM